MTIAAVIAAGSSAVFDVTRAERPRNAMEPTASDATGEVRLAGPHIELRDAAELASVLTADAGGNRAEGEAVPVGEAAQAARLREQVGATNAEAREWFLRSMTPEDRRRIGYGD